MTLRLMVAPRFERAIAAMEQHYLMQRDEHPDAGVRFERFVGALLEQIVPLLAQQPAIERRYLPRAGDLHGLVNELARLQVASRGQAFEMRRWPHAEFELLYAHSRSLLVLISARSQRQQEFF